MSKTKSFTAKVECELGWEYPDALVVVYHGKKVSEEEWCSSDVEGDYSFSNSIGMLEYRASFWPDTAAQRAGKEPRPLLDRNDSEDRTKLSVDLEHPESVQIINGAASPSQKDGALIECDIRRRFK